MADDAIKTVAGEITKIAVEHGYNGAAPKTITGAIDALADTLAGSDVDSGQTVAQAVRSLAPYIGSGSGGGSLGALVDTNHFVTVSGMPEVGNEVMFGLNGAEFNSLSIGSQIVAQGISGMMGTPIHAPFVASGFVAQMTLERFVTAYRYTFALDEYNTATYTSFTEFTDYTRDGDFVTFTIPELAENEGIVFVGGAS